MFSMLSLSYFHLRKNMFSKGYLFTLFSLPFFMVVSLGLGKLIDSVENKIIPIGVVDKNNFFQVLKIEGKEENIEVYIYSEVDEAKIDLDSEKIKAYYVFPSDYPSSQQVDLYYIEQLSWSTQEYFQDLIRLKLLKDYSSDLVNRVLDSPEVTLHSVNTKKTFPGNGPTAGDFAPILLAVLFIFSLFPISELLVGALGDEKANRTVEVLMTSINPSTLVVGKLLAVLIMVVVEIGTWLAMIGITLWVGSGILDILWMQNINVVWADIGKIAILALIGLLFYCSFLIFIGTLLHQIEDVRQASSLVILPLFLPLYVLPTLMESPGSLLANIFSLLPFTSVQTIGIQILFVSITTGKVITAAAISLVSTLLFAWLASRSFRIGMLRYGKKFRIKKLLTPNRGSTY